MRCLHVLGLVCAVGLMGSPAARSQTPSDAGAQKHAIVSPTLRAVGPYSIGMEVGGFVFISGQVHLDASTGKLTGDDIAAQTRQVLENLKSALTTAGLDFGSVVKTTVYLADIKDFSAMNAVYQQYVVAPFPARSTVAVAGLPLGARIEIELIAHR